MIEWVENKDDAITMRFEMLDVGDIFRFDGACEHALIVTDQGSEGSTDCVGLSSGAVYAFRPNDKVHPIRIRAEVIRG